MNILGFIIILFSVILIFVPLGLKDKIDNLNNVEIGSNMSPLSLGLVIKLLIFFTRLVVTSLITSIFIATYIKKYI